MDDLMKVNKADLEEFNDRYYIPNNAVAIYAGDFEPEKIITMAEKYFGRIPKGQDVEPIRTYEPPQYSEKRLYGEGSAPTSLTMMFHIPPDGHDDVIPLSVLARILGSGGGGMGRFRGGGGGGSGRLYKRLVEDKQMAVSVSASSRAMWYAGAFSFRASPRLDKNIKPEDLEKEIWAEIEKIKAEGVNPEEIQQVKNRSRAQFIRSLSSASGLARSLGRAELNRGWRSVIEDQEALKKVTNEDIKRVAAEYFVKDNSLTAVYTRKMAMRKKRRR
jgi:predicted Zn-dependent peptidase